MLESIQKVFKNNDLRNKIFFVLAMLVIFRIAAKITIPGVDQENLKSLMGGNQFLGFLNLFSGGALDNLSIVMLGVAPYITGSIIMQLLTMIFPRLKEWYHEAGEQGRQKFNQISRIMTVPLAILQGFGLIKLLQSQGVIGHLDYFSLSTNLIVITAGSVFLMWIGELISEKNIGNGISLLIFAGIIANFPIGIQQTLVSYDSRKILSYAGFIIVTILVVVGVVLVNEAQRNIPVQYAKRVRGNKMYGGASTYLPLRINQAGVMPIIFAISILMFPQMIASFLSATKITWLINAAATVTSLTQNQWIYGGSYFVLVVLFTFFYTAIVFEPKTISENLQKNGGFIPGIRPGQSTTDFMNFLMLRITLSGAIFLGIIAVLPLAVKDVSGISTFAVGGTSLLIAVSVVIEIIKQIQAQMVMVEYE
ncbi:MAG: Protein translocase subunit SecY [Parcubacteria group bacterium GW2011_GWD2_38_12]|nr:MAG: Protein translocase subunit SecY [Parcubacteria group bacterium GW2011_GWC2_36_17]KKQ52174.1 MAG: Protein translocase subunit SecY [Parcubacteria group bacterium GW2011_GWD2_38_12]KKQ58231.1 MAG: Protein translocase subunit SecY [Parcubacteria group bacterium GW2011_GWD1_38_16]